VLFASKALPVTAAYRVMAEEGLAADVASAGELAMALAGGFDPERIYLHGNAKTDAELEYALDSGVGQIVIDAFDEIDRVERAAARREIRQRVLMRVTPDVAGDTHHAISTGQAESKFGVPLGEAPAAIERLRGSDHLDLIGIHVHVGSQLFDLDVYRAAVEAIAPLGDFPVWDLGGGLAVAYTAGQSPPSVEDYVEAKLAAARELLGPGKKILIEPGRSLVANAGVTLYRVVSVKRAARTYVAVDGGMSDNLRPMLYGAVYEAQIADRFGGGTTCDVVGKHCESGDVIVRDVELADPRPGDLLVTPATGAYGHAMANNYNGALRPPVIFCRDGDAREVVRRDTIGDLLARDTQ
jgi:diaminopimelate decarboxylase